MSDEQNAQEQRRMNTDETKRYVEPVAWLVDGPFEKRVVLTRREAYVYRSGLPEIETASMCLYPLYRHTTLTDAENERSVEPMAWAVVLSDGHPYERCDFRWEAQAIADALPANSGVSATVVPLYPKPTLTVKEREAVGVAAVACASCNGFANDPRIPAVYEGNEVAATLRGLLERHKGGER